MSVVFEESNVAVFGESHTALDNLSILLNNKVEGGFMIRESDIFRR